MLKGSFSLLAIKNPACAIRVSACNLALFFQLVEQCLQSDDSENDFKKIFNYCFETVRGLLIYAKEGKFDELFVQEGIPYQLAILLKFVFCQHSDLICLKLSTTVANKEIRNDEKLLDLLNYATGTIKCFTQSHKAVQEETLSIQIIPLLSNVIEKVLKFNTTPSRKAMILVQITGAMRNLANVESAHIQISNKVVKQLCDVFFDPQFNSGKELVLNIVRLLSKVSLDPACAE